ncbi:MAG: hypothetical protein KJ726_06525 [Verrucomicrobia bacterium]|nr:hypothetical protein [Verrucomicrobiota bacterium]
MLRALPSVEAVLQTARARELVAQHGHARVTQAVRESLDTIRQAIRHEGVSAAPGADVLAGAAAERLAADRPNLKRVINATGILLHTGLGRAVLPDGTA